jgi:hypothetical protein
MPRPPARRCRFIPLCLAAALFSFSFYRPAVAAAAPAPLRLPGPLSPRNASYQISARLDPDRHTVTGTATLTFRNLESQATDRLVFHLYLNAFKNHASTFIRDGDPSHRGNEMEPGSFGAIDVTSLRVGGDKDDLRGRATVDDTLMTVPLPRPLLPGAAVEVHLGFTSTLPRVFSRSGYAGPFHAVAQWFPKVAVWDCDRERPEAGCRFRAHQYHANSEFFADYGTYDVTLDVPAGTVVGATGVLTAQESRDGRLIQRWRAEDVHDFVWMTDPRFIEAADTVHDEWGEVRVRLLTYPGQEAMIPRHLQAIREGLLELERRFGPYPYGNVTAVIPPHDASGAGGMEYPTLFTSLSGVTPEGVRVLESVTVHELGHQYFYGLLASDEVEEAWIDEGLNEAFTAWGVERLYGQRCNVINLLGVCLSYADTSWAGYRRILRRAPMATPSFLFPRGTYSGVTYSQTAVTFRTLERYLGKERLEAGMRRYAERFRFRHPRRADLVSSFNEGAGEDLGWFWDQALLSTRVADYAILSARTEPHRPAAGLWDCPPPPTPPGTDPARAAQIREAQEVACAGKAPGRHLLLPPKPNDDERRGKGAGNRPHDSEIWVQRRGEFFFPITLRATFADGSTRTERWSLDEQRRDPEVRTRRFAYENYPARLVRAEVDPDGVLQLDENRLNNGLLLQPDKAPARRLSFSLQAVAQLLCELFGGI